MARITEFVVGSCSHPECAVVKGGRLAARDFPSRAYLIEAGDQKLLWDTGYSRHFLEQARGVYRLYSLVTPVAYDEAESLKTQLSHHGIDPENIDAIVLSHFHADHVAGLLDFPSVPLLASELAWSSIEGVTGLRALLQAHIPALVPVDAALRGSPVESLPSVVLPAELQPFTQGYALTRDESVLAVHLPGHAKGHLGAFVKTETGWELLASDAAWDERAYTELRGPSEVAFLIQDSRQAYYETLRKLQALHRNGVRIHLCHAPRTGDRAC